MYFKSATTDFFTIQTTKSLSLIQPCCINGWTPTHRGLESKKVFSSSIGTSECINHTVAKRGFGHSSSSIQLITQKPWLWYTWCKRVETGLCKPVCSFHPFSTKLWNEESRWHCSSVIQLLKNITSGNVHKFTKRETALSRLGQIFSLLQYWRCSTYVKEARKLFWTWW